MALYIIYHIILYFSIVQRRLAEKKDKKRSPRPEGWAGVPKKGGEEHMKNVKIALGAWALQPWGVA